jgi:hypothetical protein
MMGAIGMSDKVEILSDQIDTGMRPFLKEEQTRACFATIWNVFLGSLAAEETFVALKVGGSLKRHGGKLCMPSHPDSIRLFIARRADLGFRYSLGLA